MFKSSILNTFIEHIPLLSKLENNLKNLGGQIGMYLVTRDGDRIKLPVCAIEYNLLLSEIFEDGEEESEISLSMVGTREIAKVIEFCNYYERNPYVPIARPVRSASMEKLVGDVWYCNFVEMPKEEMFDLVSVANYLDNRVLLDLLCAKIVVTVRGRSMEEILG